MLYLHGEKVSYVYMVIPGLLLAYRLVVVDSWWKYCILWKTIFTWLVVAEILHLGGLCGPFLLFMENNIPSSQSYLGFLLFFWKLLPWFCYQCPINLIIKEINMTDCSSLAGLVKQLVGCNVWHQEPPQVEVEVEDKSCLFYGDEESDSIFSYIVTS